MAELQFGVSLRGTDIDHVHGRRGAGVRFGVDG